MINRASEPSHAPSSRALCLRVSVASFNRRQEGAVGGDVAVGHARSIERKAGLAVAVEEDEAASGVGAFGEEVDGFAGGQRGAGSSARNAWALQFR
jgi:hypothetical protein